MRRPITLFTGQWADLALADLAEKAAGWGFDGLELACWGDHFEVDRALDDPEYLRRKRELLDRYGLTCHAVSTHLVGQAVCDPLDERHQHSIPAEVWGDGDPEGVSKRAAERMKDTARAAAAFGIDVVVGFTGSAIWHRLYAFPPPDWDVVERGYEQFAERWNPIIDVFEQEGVRFALEVHPTEIAYDFVTTERTLDAIGRRPGFRLNFDPSHMVPQFLDSALFVEEFGEYIAHVHIKDSLRRLDGRRSILGSHLNFGDSRRGWDFVSAGRGDVDFEGLIRALGTVGYRGPLSIEWEDSAMDRESGAQEALRFIRGVDFEPSKLTPMDLLGVEAAAD
jgi:sugar phosphate isomerase/epimerase